MLVEIGGKETRLESSLGCGSDDFDGREFHGLTIRLMKKRNLKSGGSFFLA